MLEKYLIEHCAPTLASLKSASLFCVHGIDKIELECQLEHLNRQLQKKGILIMALRRKKNRALIYVCRKSHLQADLHKAGVTEFLSGYGYNTSNLRDTLERLKKRLGQCGSFPHEIGIFLGYPLGDVVGFIRNEGKNCNCCGCWKVYCNEYETQKLFAQFQKCREIYGRLWNQGRTVWQLTVAA